MSAAPLTPQPVYEHLKTPQKIALWQRRGHSCGQAVRQTHGGGAFVFSALRASRHSPRSLVSVGGALGLAGRQEKLEVRKAGKKEGKKTGKKEGREADRKAGRQEGRQEGRKTRRQEDPTPNICACCKTKQCSSCSGWAQHRSAWQEIAPRPVS